MRWKWILGILVAFVVILIVAVYVFLLSYDYNGLKGPITGAVKDATGRELTMGGDIDLHIGLRPTLVVENVSFQNAPWGSRPELAKIRRLEVKVALLPLIQRSIEVKRLVVIEPDLLLETDKSGKSNLEFKPQKKTELEETIEGEAAVGKTKLPPLAFNRLHIEKGNFTYRDGETGKTFTVALDILSAESTSASSPVRFKLKGVYNSEPFEASGTLGPIASLISAEKAWPVDLKTKAYDTTLSIDGTIADPKALRGIKINFTAQGNDLQELSQLGGLSLPLEGPFAISGRATDPAPKSYRISDLKVELGDSTINGLLEVGLVNDRLLLTADLSSQSLDFRPMFSQATVSGKGKGSTKADKKSAKVFPDDPLPVDALKQADASVKMQVDQLLLPQFSSNDLNLNLSLKNGFLTIKPINAGIGGGTLDGQFEVESLNETPALALKVRIDRLDLGNMLRELEATDVIDGNFGIELDLKSRGNSIAALMGRLNGNAIMMMDNGRIENRHINLLGGDLSSGVYRLFNPGGQKEKYTKVNCFVNRFDVRDGFADCTVLVFDTERMSVVGEGDINLKTEKLNLSLKPVPKEGVGTSNGRKYSLSLGELAKPFKLGGTLARPSLVLDSSQAAKTIGKAAGGALLFGPVGIAAALLSGSSDEENLCVAALEAAKRGVKLSTSKESKEEEGSNKRTTQGGKEEGKGIGSKLKQLFGR